MEHKIREIFEYNGEWYQCLRSPEKGISCDFCSLFRPYFVCPDCFPSEREDNTKVIFKKLEKVGEPFSTNILGNKVWQQRYRLYDPMAILNGYWHQIDGYFIKIEIKQNKKNMEEKKQKMDKLVTDYSANKITYKEFEKRIIELYADKHTDVNKPTLKEFDLEAAKAGKPVCTRDGRKARIICFDAKFPVTGNIVALIEKENGEEVILYYYNDGQCNVSKDYDLVMLPEKKEGWMNVYKGELYNTLESAKENCAEDSGYIKTIKVDWEE